MINRKVDQLDRFSKYIKLYHTKRRESERGFYQQGLLKY